MNYQNALKEKISALTNRPEHRWEGLVTPYMSDGDDAPAARTAGFQCSLDFDIWEGLRNPAAAGLYPAGLEEIFSYHAYRRRSGVDEDGRPSVFKVSRTWDWARKTYRRAIVISAQLPLSPEAADRYNRLVKKRNPTPWEEYGRIWSELGLLLEKGINRLSYDLVNENNAVVVMNDKNVAELTETVIPPSRRGDGHGYCKGDNYSQKSVAALTGLGQFGLHRLIMRDEKGPGGVRRLIGPLRSLVIFDRREPGEDLVDQFPLMDDQVRRSRRDVNDLTKTGEVDKDRFCTWQSGCGLCLSYCPGKAIGKSSPGRDGGWSEEALGRKNFFRDGMLQFAGADCADERGQMAALYDEWMCGRCLSICVGEGKRRESAAMGV